MTTLRDLLRDMIYDYNKTCRDVPDEPERGFSKQEEQAIEDLLDEYTEIIKERFVG
jgi:hypothetical protein